MAEESITLSDMRRAPAIIGFFIGVAFGAAMVLATFAIFALQPIDVPHSALEGARYENISVDTPLWSDSHNHCWVRTTNGAFVFAACLSDGAQR